MPAEDIRGGDGAADDEDLTGQRTPRRIRQQHRSMPITLQDELSTGGERSRGTLINIGWGRNGSTTALEDAFHLAAGWLRARCDPRSYRKCW